MNEPSTSNPDMEVAAALNELVRKLKGRAENADRYVRHKRTLDKVIPKLSRIADDISGAEPESSSTAASSNGRRADATDAIVEALQEGPRTRQELKAITGVHHKTIEGVMRVMVREHAAEYDVETQKYALR